MKKPLNTIAYLTCLFFVGMSVNASTFIEQAHSQVSKATQKAAQTQTRINELDDQTTEDYYRYIETIHRAEQIETYNNQLRRLVDSQERELKGLQDQISSLEETGQAALPLLVKMKEMLARFVESDLPFLQDERSGRLSRLQAVLDRADISIAEKYRQVLEAYQIEVEYGRTLEAYNAQLNIDDITKDVTFLKLGRIALYYQTADGQESGVWDKQNSHWKALSADHRWSIQKGIQLARQQTVPELLDLPLSIDAPLSSGK
ncbi:DUF3450 domain-containing protein [Alkalimarinus coralli]|uniref:DUF3450 domain-containing protein n=1 Tax=Alkalimarinus coralli TaxID=2935863 RepID=UPI00202AFB55|nr:DUF3450 domain-containing protein [Alkalimarinus coralli]